MNLYTLLFEEVEYVGFALHVVVVPLSDNFFGVIAPLCERAAADVADAFNLWFERLERIDLLACFVAADYAE